MNYIYNSNNLLASVALFGELFKSDNYRDISDILADFIKGAVSFENIYSINSTEMKDLLLKIYGFKIPESVIRTILNNRLKDCVYKENHYYHFDSDKCSTMMNTKEEVAKISHEQEVIFELLCKYISENINNKLEQSDIEKIRENFSHYLMDNGYSDEYSDLISAFIIKNENNKEFNEVLNLVREGLVIYHGLTYSEDINNLGIWKDELTIYLGTEHLFNCVGFNGTMYNDIFNDFINLVNEINTISQKTNKKKIICLKYFEETKNEIDNFFNTAIAIKNGQVRLDPSKIAMMSILKGCKDENDIKLKQVRFYIELKQIGVELQGYSFERINDQYNVVDYDLITELKKDSEKKHKDFDEEQCLIFLRIFTKINYFRRGVNNLPFEKIKHIYVTDNNFAKYLGHNNKVKFKDNDIAFAKDIDYIITRFWFKLKKGFSKNSLPKTFDILTKAKTVMSSYLKSSLYKNFSDLKDDYSQGKLTKEEAIGLNNVLRDKPILPEMLSHKNIDDSLSFLTNDKFIEDYLREKTAKETELETITKKAESLQQELEYYKDKESREEARKTQFLINEESKKYAENKWEEKIKCHTSNLWYFFKVILLTILPIGCGLFISFFKPIFNFLSQHPTWKFIIYLILVILTFLEIFGRSYLFNKGKISDGWDYFKSFFSKKLKETKSHFINQKMNEFLLSIEK